MVTRFSGDPKPGETGTGQGANIPLDKTIRPTSVEMLSQDGDDDSGPDDDEAPAQYSRERVGSRIGEPVENAPRIDEVEEQLDSEDVVPCLFQSVVNLQDKGIMHHWGPGVHMVPVSLAGDPRDKNKPMHWWLKRNKVKRTGGAMTRSADEEEAAS